jgi:hypothetical protein
MDLVPLDEETAAQLASTGPSRSPSFPPNALDVPVRERRDSPITAERPLPPAAPAPRASAPGPQPPAAPTNPKVVLMLADDPTRISLEVNVGSTTDSNFYVDASDQLLDGGVFVATYSPLPVGSQTALTITLPGKLIVRAHGTVVLTRDLMDAFADHIPGMCVAFDRIDQRSLALIERFTRKRSPTFLE